MAQTPRFPWVTVSAVVAVGLVSTTAWLQIPIAQTVEQESEPLPVLIMSRPADSADGELLAERLAAYDPTPLFIPSALTSSGLGETVSLRGGDSKGGRDGPFRAFPAELIKNGPLPFPSNVPIPVGPLAGLRLTERSDAPLALGRVDDSGKPLARRGGYLEAVAVGSGRVVLSMRLPEAQNFPGGDWQPLELMGSISRSGLTGGLVVTASSGTDEIDAYFRFYLSENVRIGERLPAGSYVFRVGP